MSGQGLVISEQREDPDAMGTMDELSLRIEYNITVALESVSDEYQDCDCASYLILRRRVLEPAILKMAKARKIDPAEVFHGYARALHAAHTKDD